MINRCCCIYSVVYIVCINDERSSKYQILVLNFQDFTYVISKYNFRLNWISIPESLILNSCLAFDLTFRLLAAGSVTKITVFLRTFSHMNTISLYSWSHIYKQHYRWQKSQSNFVRTDKMHLIICEIYGSGIFSNKHYCRLGRDANPNRITSRRQTHTLTFRHRASSI